MKARSGTPLNGFGLQPDAGATGKAQEHDRPDLSILRKPIQTSVTGFREAIQSYESGTEEIRNLLAHECDLIYECKACRNIFRSLANFISHKRIYCRTKFSSAQHFHFRHDESGVDRDVTTIVQAEEDFASAKCTPAAGGKSSVKDLSSVVERLLRREHASRPVPEVTASPVAVKEEVLVLQFDKVKTSDCAVFQTVRREVASSSNENPRMSKDSIRTEVNEMHAMQDDRVTTVGVDGRVVPDVKADKLTCDICQMQFDVEKTLRIHIKKHHVTSTFVYPCPSCSQTFIKPWAVMRHLSNDHKKSLRRIRQMRETILRRRTRISEIQVKGPNRELARLQLEERERTESQQRNSWPDNYSGIGGVPVPPPSSKTTKTTKSSSKHTSLCSYCGKTFERRAALSTHLKTCSGKSTSVSRVSRSSEVEQKSVAMHENDESNSNSTDSFMAMLNREKLIQAKILEHELKLVAMQEAAKAEAKAEAKASALNSTSVVEDTQNKIPTEPLRNKRKRAHVRKADVSSECRMTDDQEEMVFQWDTEYDSFDLVNVNESQLNASAEISQEAFSDALDDAYPAANKNKKTKLNLDDENGVTECTICERKFANLGNLRRHVAMFHYREKKFGCTLCQFRAYRKVDVLYHLTLVHRMSGDRDQSSHLVRSIVVDKNKFSVEREKAVADAQLKMQQKQPVQVDLEGMIDEMFSKSEVKNERVGFKEESNGHGIPESDIIVPPKKEDSHQTKLYSDLLSLDNYSVKEEITPDNTMDSMPSVPLKAEGIFCEPPLNSSSTQKPIVVQTNVVVKRRGRPKGSTMSARKSLPNHSTPPLFVASTVPPAKPSKQTKLTRHSSSNSSSSEETVLSARRPVRNRIKAVNKDFVYDMTNYLKNDELFPFRVQKRKSIGIPPATTDEPYEMVATDESAGLAPSVAHQQNAMLQVKGAALVMAQISVLSNRACFNRAPEVPVERPIVPAKILALRRSVGSEWHVMTPDMPTLKPLNRRASNEQFCDTLARKKQAFDKTNQPVRPTNESVQHTIPISNTKHQVTQNGLSDEHPITLKLNAFAHHVVDKIEQPNSNTSKNGSIELPVELVPYANATNTFHSLPPAHQTSLVIENVTPKRISVIDRLAEIHTRKLQELRISSGDENQ